MTKKTAELWLRAWASIGVSSLVLASALSLSTFALASDTEEAALLDLENVAVEGGIRAPAEVELINLDYQGEALEGFQATLEHRKNAYPTVHIATEASAEVFNTLIFKVYAPGWEEKSLNFGVGISDRIRNWNSTTFSKHGRALGKGWYEFSWDILNQPDVDRGADLTDITRVFFKFDYAGVPEGEEKVLQIVGLKLVSGRSVQAGDPALFTQWKAKLSTYEPDYSDSSKALLSPETGRIKEPLLVIGGGRPNGEIVLSASASGPEKKAASELQYWLKKITEVELPLVESPTESDNVKIFLGRSFADKLYATDLATLKGGDGFAVRANGKNVFIFGEIPKGTLNGVFAFLENNTDIIWLRPHPDYGTLFSRKNEFKIVWADALERPATLNRGWLPNVGIGDWFHDWSSRNRNNYTTGDALKSQEWGEPSEFGGGHNLQSFIPKDDAQYYPVIEGVKPEKLNIWKHQICMSVPDLETTYARGVVEYIQAKAPAAINTFNIKIEDNWGVCECEQCVAPIILPGGKSLSVDDPAFRSTQFYLFLNKVTEEINKVYPDLMIQTYAYFFAATPPAVVLNPHISILFCPYVRKDHRTPLYSPVNDHWWKMQAGWAKATPNVIVREYYGILNEGRPLAEVVAADVRSKLDMGIRSFGAEINQDVRALWWDGEVRGAGDEFDLNMMDYWVINKLYWNPEANVEDLRKYFIRRTFHNVAPQMERVFGIIRENWYKGKGASTWGNGRAVMLETVVKPGKEEEIRSLLATAFQQADHPVSRILVGRVKQRIEECLATEKSPSLSPTKRDGKMEVDPSVILEYGWRLPMLRTTIERKGEIMTALHIRFQRGANGKIEDGMTRPMIFDATGAEFSYTLAAGSVSQQLGETLPVLSISDINGVTVSAPQSAYSANADGTASLRWIPAGDGHGKQLDFKKINRLRLAYPAPEGGSEYEGEFYITDLKMTKSIEEGN